MTLYFWTLYTMEMCGILLTLSRLKSLELEIINYSFDSLCVGRNQVNVDFESISPLFYEKYFISQALSTTTSEGKETMVI